MNINILTIRPDARIRNLQSKVKYRWYSLDVIAATLVHRTNEKNVFREFDCIIMKNMSHHLFLFCGPTWPSYHVIEYHLFADTGLQSCSFHVVVSEQSNVPI